MKTEIIRSDENYASAVNYKQSLYNFPVTISIKNKSYILGCGSSDSISVKVRKGIVYVIGVNSGLEYISLTTIDHKTDTFRTVFYNSNDIHQNKPNLLDLSTNFQIRYLLQYIIENL